MKSPGQTEHRHDAADRPPRPADDEARAERAAAGPPAAPRRGLDETERRFRLLVESVKDYAIFMLDAQGYIATWNIGAERIKGYRAAEIVGRHFSSFYLPDEVASGKCERALAIASEEGKFEEEGWRVRKDGTTFWAFVVITALRDETGALVGFAKVTRDLTERKRLEEERVRNAQAQEAIRLRDEFLSIVSHELKTPLTVLQLQLLSLRERTRAEGGPIAAKAEKALASTQRLGDLIDSLLDVSRIATGQFALAPVPLDLAELIDQVLESMGPAAARAGCELRPRLHRGSPGLWDRVRMEQVITNLLSNAIKYGAGFPVDVTLERQGSDLVLEVADRGPGLPEGDLARVFERFERASASTQYGGLGVGLYVAREVVSAHGGKVAASNRPEGGACFRVTLPLAAPSLA
jgi:PAS domain S-box-containing protein